MGEHEISQDVEPWIAQTQATLGACIARPRLLPERLRKPPFRFLFDIAVEVSRQTGFGVAELFGEIPEKPTAPGSREEKVDFLQRWISVTAGALPSHAEALAEVSPVDVVCGVQPERTNYFLQCLCAAAFRAEESTGPPVENGTEAPTAPAPPAPEEPEQREEALPDAPCVVVPPPVVEAPEVTAAREAAEKAAAQKRAAEEELARVQAAREERAAQAAALSTEVPDMKDMDAAVAELGTLQQEFERTANAWSLRFNAGDAPEDSSDSEDAPRPPLPGQLDEDQDHRFASTGMLFQAKERANKANEELARAQYLIADIEDALDARDAELQQKRNLEVERREAMAAAADAKVLAEQAAEEERRIEKAARKAKRKAEKLAEKERLQRQAEEQAAEQEAEQQRAAMYPVSKTSQVQGGRLVSCVGAGEEEEEYEFTFDEKEPAEVPRADGMDACFSDDILGQADDFGSATLQKEELFEQIKAETRDTFVSYLCATLPSVLLKKYPSEQLVSCLQMLTQELRRFIMEHGLEDVLQEEPTSVAEELRQGAPDGWLEYLQSMSPYTLRQRFDLTELVDTFQALSQTCFDRLTDELGPMTRWVPEDSLLYVSPPPPAPPSLPAEAVQEERPTTSHGQSDTRPVPPGGQWPERLSTAPPARSPSSRQPDLQKPKLPERSPVFDATLGPAPWEVEGPGPGPCAVPSTGRVGPVGNGRLGSALPLRPGTTQVTRPLLSR